MKKILIGISLLTALCSCHPDDDEESKPSVEEASRTVLVYMAAENNLASFSDDDLNEMKTGSLSLSKDQNLVVYINRAGATTPPYLARVRQGELVDTVYMPKGVAADPNVLTSALQQAITSFPAESYGLVLWGHGSGWHYGTEYMAPAQSRAYGGSTGNNTSSGSGKYWMNIPQMSKAIKDAIGGNKLKFILADCCNLGSIEIAYELRRVTDYYIASPAEIPDSGAPYDLLTTEMFKADTYYQDIIDAYYNYYLEAFAVNTTLFYNRTYGDLTGFSLPLAAVKCDELESFASATAELLSTIGEKLSPSGAVDYEGILAYELYSGYVCGYDMKHLMKKNVTQSDFAAWEKFLDKTIPYSTFSSEWLVAPSHLKLMDIMNISTTTIDDAASVSMYLPDTKYSQTFNIDIMKYEWSQVVNWTRYGW